MLIHPVPPDPTGQAFMLRLLERHERLLYAIIRQSIQDPDTLQDLFQETLVKLTEKQTFLRTLDPGRLTAYIAAVARNTTYTHLRKQAREEAVRLPWTPDLEAYPAQTPPLEADLVQKEEKQTFLRIWQSLPSEDRYLLQGKYILRQSDQVLAETLGCKPDSVRMKLTRLRRKILKQMQKGEDPV